jgi:hypothetical protein
MIAHHHALQTTVVSPTRRHPPRPFHLNHKLYRTAISIHHRFPQCVAHFLKTVASYLPHQVRSLPMASRGQSHLESSARIGRQSCVAAFVFCPRLTGLLLVELMKQNRQVDRFSSMQSTVLRAQTKAAILGSHRKKNRAGRWAKPAAVERENKWVSRRKIDLQRSTKVGSAKWCRKKIDRAGLG